MLIYIKRCSYKTQEAIAAVLRPWKLGGLLDLSLFHHLLKSSKKTEDRRVISLAISKFKHGYYRKMRKLSFSKNLRSLLILGSPYQLPWHSSRLSLPTNLSRQANSSDPAAAALPITSVATPRTSQSSPISYFSCKLYGSCSSTSGASDCSCSSASAITI